jgi:hypothetical protein
LSFIAVSPYGTTGWSTTFSVAKGISQAGKNEAQRLRGSVRLSALPPKADITESLRHDRQGVVVTTPGEQEKKWNAEFEKIGKTTLRAGLHLIADEPKDNMR